MTQEQIPIQNPVHPDTPTPKRTTGQRLLALGLVAIICAAGLVMAQKIIKSKPKASRKPPLKMQTLVQAIPVHQATFPRQLETLGTVLSAQTLALKPAVAGTVENVHPNLVPGGVLQEGDTVLHLDPRDYRLTHQRRRNDLEKAAMDLRLEQGSQSVARREYELISQFSGVNLKDAPIDLALRKPQLAKAKAAKAAAETEVAMAKLNLDRTQLRCPFNAIVLDTNVEVGAQVNSQTTIATLAGTDVFWVRATLAQKELINIILPESGKDGSSVKITTIRDQEKTAHWQGKIIHLLGDVDPKGLMARVLIEIAKPTDRSTGKIPLLLGSVVRTTITGIPLKNCFRVPRSAVRPDQSLLIATKEKTLEIRQVSVIWQNKDQAYIDRGLHDGDLVIISNVAAPINGMDISISTPNTPHTPSASL